jgi:hypothetical protein
VPRKPPRQTASNRMLPGGDGLDLGNVLTGKKSLAAGASDNEAVDSRVVADVPQRRTNFVGIAFFRALRALGGSGRSSYLSSRRKYCRKQRC